MPTSVVHAAVGLLLAAGLLGKHYDRRALLVILAVILAPELDSALGFVMPGAHRTVFHTMLLSVLAAGLVYWDTHRSDSWLRGRWGDYGVRVAWVALFAHTFAHIGLDWTHLDGINIIWPLVDQFFALDGELYISSEGLVQTFVDISLDPETGQRSVDAGGGGTSENVHVSTPVQPSNEPDPGPVDRRFPIAVGGWQLYFLVVGVFTLVARRLQTPQSDEQ
ncbi:MAG: metal-dependent hydrolase [Halohasta sp.]